MVLKTTAQRKFQLFEMDIFICIYPTITALRCNRISPQRREEREEAGPSKKSVPILPHTVILSILPAAFHLSLFPFASLAS